MSITPAGTRTRWRRRLLPLLRRAGVTWTGLRDGVGLMGRHGRRARVRRIAGDAWLVQIPERPTDPLMLQSVDDRTWVVQRRRGRRRFLQQIGPDTLRTHLLGQRPGTRGQMRQYQRHLGIHLGQQHIAWMLRELRINCVLDVGGNVGQYGRMLREHGFEGRIVSFEPLPHLARRLEATASTDPDWQVVRCALGEADAEADMTVVGGRGSTSSLLPASEFGKQWSHRLEGVREEKVPIRRLEDLFDEAVAGIDNPRVYLKLDTQGYDLHAFRGAGACIDRIVGLQSEVSNVPIYDRMPRLPEQISTYEAAGFETTGMFPVTIDGTTLRVIEFDVVMIRTAGLRDDLT